MVLNHKHEVPIINKYNPPDGVGIDRLVDSVAVVKLYGNPCIILDIGTCLVLNAITDNNEYPKFEKMEFSCINNKNFIKYINDYNFKNIIVSGIESHICVLQTSMDLLQKGLNILIPRDAIGSRNEIDNDTAFLRLILSGAVASTTESLICDLCKTANRKEFREVSKILKNSFSN